jgi:hypothetical protein
MYQPVEQKSWFRRNLKWLIPVGCVLPLLACVGFVAAIGLFVFGVIRSSEVYTQALERARASEEVQAALGTPIEDGWFVSGSINTSGSSGNADFAIPLSGPNGSATLYVVATKSADRWRFSTLDVAVEDSADRIDLLANSDGSIREHIPEAKIRDGDS